MKKRLLPTLFLLLAAMVPAVNLSAQIFPIGVNKAERLTEKGFIDKKTTFNPTALDSLLKCDQYVMLISSFEGCTPCEWLRTSDVFDLYPITPYYTDFLLNSENATIPYTFYISGFPTCIFFDRTGEIVAVTVGTNDYYEKLDKIVKEGQSLCEHSISGIPAERMLPFLNYSYKAGVAYIKGEADNMYAYATKAMEIHPNFYNRYLLHKYYLNKNDISSADKYKRLALENADGRDNFIYKKLIKELKEE